MRLRTILPILTALIVMLAAVMTGCAQKAPESATKDRVVADVNGTKIYFSDVEAQLTAIIGSHTDQFQGEEGQAMLNNFRQQILESLIERELIIQEAENTGIEVTEEEINKRIEELKAQFQSEEQFKAALQQAGITEEELPEEVRRMLLTEKMLDKVFEDLEVTDEEARQYYEENKNNFQVPETANVAHILVTDEETAKKVIDEINAGKSFEDAVAEYSQDAATQGNNGEIGFQSKEVLSQMFGPDFADAAFSLEAGEVYSEPVVSVIGYHVIKLVEKKEAHLQTFEEAEEQIKTQLLAQKQQEAYQKWIEEVKANAKIERYL